MSVDLAARLKVASELVSEKSILELTHMVWANDRFFTFPAFQTTAKTVVAKLTEWGVKADTTELPADGKTLLGDWRMPLGWDCSGATLEIVEPAAQRGKVLADRKKFPAHVIMWSGPTPAEGITAEVVKVADRAALTALASKLRGKIVFTPAHPREFKQALAEAGVAAVVTSFSPSAQQVPDACFWVNAWSDNPGGWAFHAGDTPLPGMTLTPRTGKELDDLLAHGPVKLKIKIDSKYMETILPIVSGFVPGPEESEILAIGHAMEQGINDNASGCAVILESLRVLQAATADGKLPPLRRGVRGVLVSECYGTIGYAVRNRKIIKRMIAGVNFDSLARHQEAVNARFRHVHCADASASVADTLMALLLETWLPRTVPYVRLRKDQPFSLTDNAYCDPALGVECVYVDSQDRFWHTSADTMDQVAGATLHAFGAISLVYLHFLASATASEVLWLAHQTCRRYGRQLEDVAGAQAADLESAGADKATTLAHALDYLDYVREIGDRAILSAQRLMSREERTQNKAALGKIRRHLRRLADMEARRLKDLASCEPATLAVPAQIADIADRCPLKKFVGTPTYDSLPTEIQRAMESPTWSSALHCALFWAQGKLPFKEIVRRTNYEFGHDCTAMLARHFRFMAENGLVEWRQA